jgi:hypothetical protein
MIIFFFPTLYIYYFSCIDNKIVYYQYMNNKACNRDTIRVEGFAKNTLSIVLLNALRHQYETNCLPKKPNGTQGNGVSTGYVISQYKKADYIFVAIDDNASYIRNGSSTRADGQKLPKVCGFVFLQHKKKDACCYIDIVCGKGVGKILLDISEEFAHNTLKVECMKLSSLEHVLCYYTKRGYRQTDEPCKQIAKMRQKGTPVDGYRMTKCIKEGSKIVSDQLPLRLPKSCHVVPINTTRVNTPPPNQPLAKRQRRAPLRFGS